MSVQRLQRLLRMEKIAFSLTGLGIGLLASILANFVYEHELQKLPWIVAAIGLLAMLSGIAYWAHSRSTAVSFKPPVIIRTKEEEERHARRAFIGFVSLYTPQRGTLADKLTPQERAQAVRDLDFDKLNLEESNLQPMIRAIMTHASRLEHCWLIATDSATNPGSLPHARLLAEFLRLRKGLGRCIFHYGENYVVRLDDDALVVDKTYDKMQEILQEAERLNYRGPEVIADITAGIRTMSMSMILSCLDKEYDIQMMGTHYNEQGRQEGLFPIIFSFEPEIDER